MPQWNSYPDFDQASEAAAAFIAEKITECLRHKSLCHVVLPGGASPKNCLLKLAGYPIDWDRVHWYPGDERCVDRELPERNDLMLRDSLFSVIDAKNFHPIPAELGAKEGAVVYSQAIAQTHFDIVVLGMGEDGHTASLFPANPALLLEQSAVPVFNSPKPPPERVSIGLGPLQQADERVILTGGVSKRAAIGEIQRGGSFPVTQIGDATWFVDDEAFTTG